MSDMLQNVWGRVTLYCTNHKVPVPMKIIQNTEYVKTPFYACENYLPTDTSIPPCSNRLNMDDYQGIVLKFLEAVTEKGPTTDFSNYGFEYKRARQKISVRILKYSDDEIRIGIRNVTVLGKE